MNAKSLICLLLSTLLEKRSTGIEGGARDEVHKPQSKPDAFWNITGVKKMEAEGEKNLRMKVIPVIFFARIFHF